MKSLGLTVAAVVLGLAAAANAATTTVSQTFSFTGNPTETKNSFVMTEGDLTLTLGAALYKTPGAVGSELATTDALRLTRSNLYGLYIVNTVNNGGDRYDNDHRIDGYNNEIVTFAFDRAVRITNVTFGHILKGSVFDLYIDDLYQGSQTAVPNLDLTTGEGSVFAIGASAHTTKEVCTYTYSFKRGKKQVQKYCYDTLDTYAGFKITSLTAEYDVTTVPLPAGGVLLLGGLGALAVLRRRKAA